MTTAVLLMVLSTAAGVFVPGWIQKVTASEVGLTGCLEEGTAPGTFVLRGARQKPDDPLEKGADYLVNQVTPLLLEAHVNHSVRLFGVVKANDAAPSTDSEATEASLPSLNARELTMASETCATDADDESEEFEGLEGDSSSGSGGRIRFGDLGAAGVSGGWPQLTGGFQAQPSLKSDLAPDLFAGISGGYRIALVSGLNSSGKVNAFETGAADSAIDQPGATHTSGWVGSAPPHASGWVDAWPGQPEPAGLLAALNNVPTDAAGPAIALNAVATHLGVDLSGMADPLAPTSAPAPIPNPEPASLILFGTGLLAVAVAARRRRARRTNAAV